MEATKYSDSRLVALSNLSVDLLALPLVGWAWVSAVSLVRVDIGNAGIILLVEANGAVEEREGAWACNRKKMK